MGESFTNTGVSFQVIAQPTKYNITSPEKMRL